MAITGGFTGKTLRVDLTTRTSTVEDTLTKYGKFWGGTGLAYKVLWDEVPNSVKWSDPENRIIFGWGPLTGSGALCAGRTAITSLAPVHPDAAVATGHFGGHFSAEAKYAGWDSIIIQGKANGPVYIAIRDDKVEIVDCPQLWGSGLHRTTNEIMEAMGASAQVAAIGIAGQNLVAQSVVMTGSSHSAGAGMGAVMGSKNCVGIGVVGTGTVKIAADKRAFRTLVENAHAIIGSNNQAFLPNSPQPWAEYTANQRWYAKKGQYWGAANPPVETGICDPHDRQSLGYRCFKSDPGKYGEFATVRMDGCHACPVRCHQMIYVPSAVKWGLTNPYAQNTCTGWWGNGLMDTTKYNAATATNGDVGMTKLESYVVGNYMTNDMGLWNNYGIVQATFQWFMGNNATVAGSALPGGPKDFGLSRVKPFITGSKINVYGTLVDEWTYLNNTSANADSGLPGLITLYKNGDLRAMLEYGRLVANRIGKFGEALGRPLEDLLDYWQVDGEPIREPFVECECSEYWNNGLAWHHGDAHTGILINIGYNTHAQNHCFGPNFYGNVQGLPKAMRGPLAKEQFAKLGYADMDTVVDYSTPFVPAKARAAKWAQIQKELTDSTGLCSWMYPWLTSPLKERGYRGDSTLISQWWNLVTGDNKTPAQFEDEGARFHILQRVLTIKRHGSVHIRDFHDRPQAGREHSQATNNGKTYEYWYTNWDTAGGTLDTYYDEWGFDRATGAPTRATLEKYGMGDVADALKVMFPAASGGIWG